MNAFETISMLLTSLIVIMLFPWIHGKCRHSHSQTNLKLEGHVIKSVSKAQGVHCIDECAQHDKCHSINFFQDKKVCELNDANHLSNPEGLVYSYGSAYLNYFSRPVTKCSNKLCSEPQECQIIDGGLNYKCKDFVLNFPRKSVDDKVVVENAFDNLTAFTVAMWVQPDPSTSSHTPFSYAINNTHPESSDEKENEITFMLYEKKTEIYIGNDDYDVSTKLLNGKWHHISLTWENTYGQYNFCIDGIVVQSESSKHVGRVITKGAIVLGQDQDDYLGNFQTHQSFQGNMTSVNMWDKVLTAQEISDLAKSCASGEGNIVKWSDLKNKGEGAVKLIPSLECGRSL